MLDLDYLDRGRDFMAAADVKPNNTTALVVARALERGISVKFNRKEHAVLSMGRHSYTFRGGFTTFNSMMARRCARQKEVGARLLHTHGITTPQNACFNEDDSARAWKWAQPILPVVIKPNTASHGKNIFVGVEEHRQFKKAFKAVARQHGRVLVERFVAGTEHRVTVVDGRVVAATRRIAANVIGDGVLTIDTLVAQKNLQRAESGNPAHFELTIDRTARVELKRQGYRAQSIPALGHRVYLRATTNIHTGGDAVDATDDLALDEVKFVERAARAMPGLRLAGFDVLLPREESAGCTEACILDINHAPMISMHHFPWTGTPRDVAAAVLDAMFPSAR